MKVFHYSGYFETKNIVDTIYKKYINITWRNIGIQEEI